ncbi:hypothetical protein V8G54_020687 [Vigna mungo]|uniref:Uncharacterized protein n=1 Tax=Vigna mungo TaxID=3915 RepID=A0AAQ3NE36_VIGMU
MWKLGFVGQCGNWALGLVVEIELSGPRETELMGQYGNWAWWANVKAGLCGQASWAWGQCKNWALGASVETGLWGQASWAWGHELGLGASVETGLRGQAKLGFGASAKLGLLGQYRNWVWWASVETGLCGPGKLVLGASVETGLSNFEILEIHNFVIFDGFEENESCLEFFGRLGPVRGHYSSQRRCNMAKTHGEIHKVALVFRCMSSVKKGSGNEKDRFKRLPQLIEGQVYATSQGWFPEPRGQWSLELCNQLGVKTQMKRTNSSWGSHDSQTGSMSQVASLHNPSTSKLHSDPVAICRNRNHDGMTVQKRNRFSKKRFGVATIVYSGKLRKNHKEKGMVRESVMCREGISTLHVCPKTPCSYVFLVKLRNQGYVVLAERLFVV